MNRVHRMLFAVSDTWRFGCAVVLWIFQVLYLHDINGTMFNRYGSGIFRGTRGWIRQRHFCNDYCSGRSNQL
jgi:hypothetical protein